jgi:hypothetical protein
MDIYDFRGAYQPTGGRVGVRTGGAGRKRCTKGKSCGATCINAAKACWVDLGGEPGSNGGRNLHDATSKVRDLVKGRMKTGSTIGANGARSTPPKPQPIPQPKPQPAKEKEKEKVPDKNLWQSAQKGDLSQLKKQTENWAKEHGLSMIDGHDHAHSMIHSYLGVNSNILARLGGGKKGDISPLEEGLVYHFDRLGKDRRGSEGTPIKSMTKQEIVNNIGPMIKGLYKGTEQENSPQVSQNIQRATNIIYNLQSRKDYAQFVNALDKASYDIVMESFLK